MKTIRPNYAEGKFYPADPEALKQLFKETIQAESPNINFDLTINPIIGGVVPHAGYIFCAKEAVHFFDIVKYSEQTFDVVIIINPNHTGQGLPVSVDQHDFWQSPLGISPIDRELAKKCGFPFDTLSQAREHSGEVILPYIHYFMQGDIPILPVSFGAQNHENSKVIADILFMACKALNRKPLIIASSDFNHFATPAVGADLDGYALEALLKKDTLEFERRVKEKNISICGFGTIQTLIQYARLEGEFVVNVLKRGHSGEVHPSDQVVDYVSMLVSKATV